VTRGPSRGLPPRIYLPILAVTMLVFLGIVGYFLRIGLSTTGSALGPAVAEQGDARIATVPGNSVGGGSPAQATGAGPPAPVQRLLTELKGRIARNPRDESALTGLASLYADAGKFDQALPYYRRALALDPNNARLRADYASALEQSGQR